MSENVKGLTMLDGERDRGPHGWSDGHGRDAQVQPGGGTATPSSARTSPTASATSWRGTSTRATMTASSVEKWPNSTTSRWVTHHRHQSVSSDKDPPPLALRVLHERSGPAAVQDPMLNRVSEVITSQQTAKKVPASAPSRGTWIPRSPEGTLTSWMPSARS